MIQYGIICFTILAFIFCIGQVANSSFALATTDISAKKNVTQDALKGVDPKTPEPASPPRTYLSLSTDRVVYVPGQTVKVLGSVTFLSQVPPSKKYIVNIHGLGTDQVLLTSGGQFNTTLYINSQQKPGIQKISAIMPEIPKLSYQTTFEIQDLFLTRSSIMFYVGVGGFIALIVVIALRQNRVGRKLDHYIARKKACEKKINELSEPTLDEVQLETLKLAKGELAESEISIADYTSMDKSYEMYRFICLSIIAIAPIVAIALSDVEITPTAPIGLITKLTGSNTQNNTREGIEWMINIGGVQNDHYSAGIQIPVNVVIFGIGGAYLRYLYKTATEIREQGPPARQNKPLTQQKNEQTAEQERVEIIQTTDFFYESLKDIALFFLAPLLAIIVWLILWQGGMTSTFTLAAVSFGVGLVTNDIVNFIIRFMRRVTSAAVTTQGD